MKIGTITIVTESLRRFTLDSIVCSGCLLPQIRSLVFLSQRKIRKLMSTPVVR